MLFIFGVLSFKTLLAPGIGLNNCDEFGHIHLYELESFKKINTIHKVTESGEAKDCHEGKSFVGNFVFPARTFVISRPVYKTVFALVLSLDNNFKSPPIEPLRKPPRSA